MKKALPLKIALFVTAAALLSCLAQWPYNYYVCVRILTMLTFIWLAADNFRHKATVPAAVCAVAAVVFQPLTKIPLTRDIWEYLDIAAALFLYYSIIRLRQFGR